MWVWAHSAPNAHSRRAPGAAPPSTEPTSVASLQQRGVAWMFALCGVCRQRQAARRVLMAMDCRVVERMCARPVCCCILHHVYCICILILILILGTIPISYTVDPAILAISSRRKT